MKKNIIFFSLLAISAICGAQTTTSDIVKTSDSTFVEVTVTTYQDGKKVTTETPYNLAEFSEKLVDIAIQKSIEKRNLEQLAINNQRDINLYNRYVTDSLKVNADSILHQKLHTAISGDWLLIDRTDNSRTKVKIDFHPTLSVVLRMTNSEGPGAFNIKGTDTQSFEIRNYKGENVTMLLTDFSGFTGYRGVTSTGVLILRR